MLYMHVGMILTGMTTVEKMEKSSMEFRESMLLAKFYSWWEFGWAFFNSNFSSFCWHSIPQWLTVPRRRNGESGTRNGVRYRRKVISGGRGVDMQSGWMLWVFRGWDGFVSGHFISILYSFFFAFSPGIMIFLSSRGLGCGSLVSIFTSFDPLFGRICRTYRYYFSICLKFFFVASWPIFCLMEVLSIKSSRKYFNLLWRHLFGCAWLIPSLVLHILSLFPGGVCFLLPIDSWIWRRVISYLFLISCNKAWEFLVAYHVLFLYLLLPWWCRLITHLLHLSLFLLHFSSSWPRPEWWPDIPCKPAVWRRRAVAKPCGLARRVAISPSLRHASFLAWRNYGQETEDFGPFLFNHLDYICYLYHTSFSMSIHGSKSPYVLWEAG